MVIQVLETVTKEEERKREKAWLCTANLQLGLAHRTVPCPVRQAGLQQKGHSRVSMAAYGYNSPDCPVSQRSPAQRSVVQSSRDA
jgi:hypothetical protein